MEFPDTIFKAYDIRGKVGSELNEDLCRRVGQALGTWLPVAGTVAVGYDMRPDSKSLAAALIDGLRTQGRDVMDIGQVTSDMIYFAIGHYDLAGGAVVTASHNPGEYNGIKIYRDKVTPVGLDSGLSEIRDLAKENAFHLSSTLGDYEQKTITKEWVEHAVSIVKPETWPNYHIAVDTGNGMAGAIMPEVLAKIPQLDAKRLFFELDGTFPNHEANPQKPETLEDLINIVRENNFDFGVAFDGDGDRAGFVDDKGRPVLGTDLISIVAGYVLKHHPGGTIVHDVRTSRATKELITEWGGTPVRTKAGRVYVGAKLREIGAVFGGETTGHLFFTENFDADSGLIAALVVIQALSESGKKLSELVDEYRRYIMPPEINFEAADKDKVFTLLSNQYSSYPQDTLDGLTVEADTFWFNLRGSNTEPLIRLNVEGSTQDEVDAVIASVNEAIDAS
jgi:phosphomannomutase